MDVKRARRADLSIDGWWWVIESGKLISGGNGRQYVFSLSDAP